jgi:asparagine synthetase B (glutamine-hydrolysing)
MAETLRRGDRGLPELAAFTFLAEGFLQEEWDALQRLAEAYGTEIHPIRPESSTQPVTFFELFLDCAETPHHDGFITIPPVLEGAAQRGCRVLLTGFGADELSQRAEEGFLADLLRSARLGRLVEGARQRAAAYGGGDWLGTVRALSWNQLPPGVRRVIKKLIKRQPPRWFKPGFTKKMKLDQWTMPKERRKFPTLCQEEPYLALTKPSMALALNQMDGMASAFSLECRHPYLDRRLIEFFLSIPSAVKMKAGYRKQFVQRAVAGITPGPIREKEGLDYFIPLLDRRISSELEAKRMERDLFHSHARVFRYVDRFEAERLNMCYLQAEAPHRNLLWSFVRLELWLQQWFPELSLPEGGTS